MGSSSNVVFWVNSLIDPQNSEYNDNLIVDETRRLELGIPPKNQLTVLDFLMIDYTRGFSVEGMGFEEQKNRLQTYREELRRYKQKFRSSNATLKDHFEDVINNPDVKKFFTVFVNKYKDYGFFYAWDLLQNLTTVIKALKTHDLVNNGKENKSQLAEALNRGTAFPHLNDNLILTNQSIRNHVREELLPLYLNNKEVFETITDRYYKSSELLSSCANLQVYDLNRITEIVNNYEVAQNIFDSREQKQFEYYDKLRERDVTINLLNAKQREYFSEGIIIPQLTRSLSPEFTTVINVIVRYTETNWNLHLNIVPYVKGIYSHKMIKKDSNEQLIFLEIRTCYLTPTERYLLISSIYDTYKTDALFIKMVRGTKYLPFITLRKYYDFPQRKYFYAKDLFPNLLLYAKKEFGRRFLPLEEKATGLWPYLLSKNTSMRTILKMTQKRVKTTVQYDESTLIDLKKFSQNLNRFLKNSELFDQIKAKPFFKNHVKAIKFLPIFSRFGLAQYHLYFYASDLGQIDFKLLLNNSFQSLKSSVGVGNAPSFLIKSMYPHGFPNMRYLNRATKTKRIIREYCVFRLVHAFFNFRVPSTSEGWHINPNEFEIQAQHILFNDKWEKPPDYLKEHNLEIITTSTLGPNSEDFRILKRIYSRKPVDLKKRLFFKNDAKLKDFSTLFSKNLVRPYVKFKNLALFEKIRFILPNVSKRVSEKLLRIFTFFDHCEAYKIEGRLFVQGLEDEIKFDNGLYVKLHLPGRNIGSIENMDTIGTLLNILEESFEVLGIDHYIVLDNMIKPEPFLNYVLGESVDLNGYNPLLNLKWDRKNKIYLNSKLYDEENNPVYPSLQNPKSITPKNLWNV